jgi:acid phosphatase (class B)
MAVGIALTTCVGYFLQPKIIYNHPNLRMTDNVNWVTLQDIAESLKDQPPMSVGFDIDDTVLFPRTAFHVSFNKFCPYDTRNFRPSCGENQNFWDHLNTTGHLSPPKQIGVELIELHKKRGDTIFFITAREKSKKVAETMTHTLQKVFNLPDLNPVIFLGLSALNPEKPGKTAAILENNIKIFYGDSDGDIAAAKAANIRGIRVLRAPNSQDNKEMPLNGRYGEEVIIGSDL